MFHKFLKKCCFKFRPPSGASVKSIQSQFEEGKGTERERKMSREDLREERKRIKKEQQLKKKNNSSFAI